MKHDTFPRLMCHCLYTSITDFFKNSVEELEIVLLNNSTRSIEIHLSGGSCNNYGDAPDKNGDLNRLAVIYYCIFGKSILTETVTGRNESKGPFTPAFGSGESSPPRVRNADIYHDGKVSKRVSG